MTDDAGAVSRYTAFLSYSHKDAAAARRLHARLEGYRIPKRLVGAVGEHGPVPRRLIPIFRDRDDLPAADDLSEQVRAALAVSEHLIVLCSPHSAASPWVAREIQAFRAIHPDRPVLAGIIAGELGACFPPGLVAVGADGGVMEPLAADLRPAGDGRRLGFLKLVAALSGVHLDALVQRDAARRIRRVTTVTLIAVAAMLVMAMSTILAIDARRDAERQRIEAERQRGEAEGLVEFMLSSTVSLRSAFLMINYMTDATGMHLDVHMAETFNFRLFFEVKTIPPTTAAIWVDPGGTNLGPMRPPPP